MGRLARNDPGGADVTAKATVATVAIATGLRSDSRTTRRPIGARSRHASQHAAIEYDREEPLAFPVVNLLASRELHCALWTLWRRVQGFVFIPDLRDPFSCCRFPGTKSRAGCSALVTAWTDELLYSQEPCISIFDWRHALLKRSHVYFLPAGNSESQSGD